MDTQSHSRAVDAVIYLAACAINGKTPDAARVAAMDLRQLYAVADRHALTAITAAALESAGVKDPQFTQARGKVIRKVAAMDADKALLFARLEEVGIWYMPLKGAVLKDDYPGYGLRQMSDFDILFDADRAGEVRRILESLGFATEQYGRDAHDCYFKPPVSNFEMHRMLFDATSGDAALCAYYQRVKDRLVKDEGNRCGWHFTVEDFYIYLAAHEYKHYSHGGTGLRSLLDTYVYLRKHGDGMRWDYVRRETEALGIAAFESQSRSLAAKLFDGEALTAGEERMLDYITASGTYGSVENRVSNAVEACGGGGRGRARYLLRRVFLPMEQIRTGYPFFYRHRLLLPLLFAYRVGRALFVNRAKVQQEIRTLSEKRH